MSGSTPEADSDADGLTDGAEAALGTDPLLADSDHDGLTDELEVEYGSDPLGSFVDSIRTHGQDGTVDARGGVRAAGGRRREQASPARGHHERWPAGTTGSVARRRPLRDRPPGQATGPAVALTGASGGRDGDQDGLTDAFEKLAGTSLTVADSDSDGLSDGYEALKSRTDPLAADTDDDGMGDAQEVSTGGDAGRLPGVAGVVGVGALAENVRNGITDTDADGLSDHAEQVLGTDAGKADSDADSLSDAFEVAIGSNPLLADTDSDGMGDAVEVQYGMDPLAPRLGDAANGPDRATCRRRPACPAGCRPTHLPTHSTRVDLTGAAAPT